MVENYPMQIRIVEKDTQLFTASNVIFHAAFVNKESTSRVYSHDDTYTTKVCTAYNKNQKYK